MNERKVKDMGKKKFKKNNKKAEQQMDSAERVSRLMEMYEAGEISDEEFIKLMNCADAADETVMDNDINDMISDAIGYDRSDVRDIDDILVSSRNKNITTFTNDANEFAGIEESLYAREEVDNRRSDIMDLEAKMMSCERESNVNDIKKVDSVPVDMQQDMISWEKGRPSLVIPGITDYSTPDQQDPSSLMTDSFDSEPNLFVSDAPSDVLSGTMPEIVIVDPDDEVVAIINRDIGMKATLDLFGASSENEFNSNIIGIETDKFNEYIKYALLMLSGNCVIAPYSNNDIQSLTSSITSLDKGKFIIFYVYYKEAGIEPFYVMYHWTDEKEDEFQKLMEWLQCENLTLEFASSLMDLVTNASMFPLLEEPRRSRYITWSDDDEIDEFVNAVNSDRNTSFGIVETVDKFHSTCCDYSLDEIIGDMYKLIENLSTAKEYQLNGIPAKIDDDNGTNTDTSNVVEEVSTDVNVTVKTIETEVSVDAEIVIDEVEDTESIQLNTNSEDINVNTASSFVMKPIVK